MDALKCCLSFCKNKEGEDTIDQIENCEKACCKVISRDVIVKFSNKYGSLNENLLSINEWLKKGWKIRTMFETPINETIVACLYR